jgi:alkane 1-monooxygenase
MINTHKDLLAFVLPLTTLGFLYSGPHSIIAATAWTLPFFLILYLDWLNPKLQQTPESTHSSLYYNGILYTLALLQFLNIYGMLEFIAQLSWDNQQAVIGSLINLIALRFLVGTSSGTSGIVVAHELIHRPQPYVQALGRLLLCTVCYEHFVITHKRGHHQTLGLPEDIATARLHESFKHYWRRIYLGYLRYAWRSERERLQNMAFVYRLLHNQVIQGLMVEIGLLFSILYFYGWLAAGMFIYQAVAAIRILEAVNYFQHWGLENGQFGKTYGWVSQSWLSRYALIGLSHHIGHHEDEHRQYYEIAYSEQGPKLPYGYFVMNLWVKLDNDSYQKVAVKKLTHFKNSLHL